MLNQISSVTLTLFVIIHLIVVTPWTRVSVASASTISEPTEYEEEEEDDDANGGDYAQQGTPQGASKGTPHTTQETDDDDPDDFEAGDVGNRSVSGIGGFVKVSSELIGAWDAVKDAKGKVDESKVNPTDFSAVKVRLVTPEGLLKAESDCAPNGYYFFPLDDKDRGASFILRLEGPAGWTYTPKQVQVTLPTQDGDSLVVDGADVVSLRDDINFLFTGFAVNGNVLDSASSALGVGGVEVILTDLTKSTVIVTKTKDSGEYMFKGVLPGRYSVSVRHPSWKLGLAGVKSAKTDSLPVVNISLVWGNARVATSFIVTGYDVRGTVMSSGQPMKGVRALLYGEENADNANISCDVIDSELETLSPRPVCVGVSDKTGTFTITGVPPGNYIIVPHYTGGGAAAFKISPSKLPIVVSRGTYNISRPFTVSGFSMSGRAIDSLGRGVSGVTITVDGSERAVTDPSGHYKIEELTAGTYTIEAVKSHVFFDALLNISVQPAMDVLPDLVISSYHLCGKLSVENPNAAGGRIVALDADGESQTRIVPITTKTDSDGNFCFEVLPGSYIVSPRVTTADKDSGLALTPSSRPVTISTSPVLDINFSQARVNIAGSVQCIDDPCDLAIAVSLLNLTSKRATKQTAEIDMRPSTNSNVKNGVLDFVFRNVSPGSYRVTVNQESWCWETNPLTVHVDTVDITGLKFIQSGYVLNSILSHSIELLIQPDSSDLLDDKPLSFQLKKGNNKFCLTQPGTYRLMPRSCFRFEHDVYSYDTSRPRVVDFEATHFEVTGLVQIKPSGDSDSLSDFAVDIIPVIGKDGKDGNANKFKQLRLSPVKIPSTLDDSIITYRYTHWASMGEHFKVEPVSSSLLFYPKHRMVKISSSECPAPVETISGRPGLFQEGSILPPIVDVVVSVLAKRGEKKSGDSKGSNWRVERTSVTGEDGRFRLGPLYDDNRYEVTAVKPGYRFERVIAESSSVDFRAIRLSTIAVTVKDSLSGTPIPGVLLSLSGQSYRNNSMTLRDGTFAFVGIPDGGYFLRPMLKEYRFEPVSSTIELSEGDLKTLTFTAHRIAFSCFGEVRSLSGAPEKGVRVEAISDKGEHEETITDRGGRFRIRGLNPGSTYQIQIKVLNDKKMRAKFERSVPSSIPLIVEQGRKEDIKGLSFIIFRRRNLVDISGTINSKSSVLDSHLPTLTIELITGVQRGRDINAPNYNVVRTMSVGISKYFEFADLPRRSDYGVRVRSSLSPRTHKFEADKVVPILDFVSEEAGDSDDSPVSLTTSAHIDVNLDISIRRSDEDIPHASFISFLLLVAVVLAIVRRDMTLIILKQGIVRIREVINGLNVPNSGGNRGQSSLEGNRNSSFESKQKKKK